MEYHKIQTVFLRDPETKYRTLLEGQFALPEFEYLADNKWVFTEKVDGTNVRIIWRNGSIEFGGKTDTAQLDMRLVKRLMERFLPEVSRFAEVFGEGGAACLYGEGYGPGISGGGKYRNDHDFVLFDVRVGDWILERHNVEDVASKLGLDVVPVIGCGTLADMVEMTRWGFKSRWGDFIAEGIVARPAVELFARSGDRIITKIKHNDFSYYHQDQTQRL